MNNFASECDMDYGAPNLELMIATYLYFVAYLNYYHEVGGEEKKFGSVMCTGYIIKMGITSFLLTGMIGFFFGSMYLGQTTYDQALFSMGLGTLFAGWFHFGVKIHFKLLPLYLSRPFDYEGVKKWCCSGWMKQEGGPVVRERQFSSRAKKVYNVGPAPVFATIISLFLVPAVLTQSLWKLQHENRFLEARVIY